MYNYTGYQGFKMTINGEDIYKYNFKIIIFFMYQFEIISRQSEVVKIGGICEYSWQCVGAGICNHTLCSCSSGYTHIDGNCYPGKIF